MSKPSCEPVTLIVIFTTRYKYEISSRLLTTLQNSKRNIQISGCKAASEFDSMFYVYLLGKDGVIKNFELCNKEQ